MTAWKVTAISLFPIIRKYGGDPVLISFIHPSILNCWNYITEVCKVDKEDKEISFIIEKVEIK